MLADPLTYTSERPEYINYSKTASLVGHEMMHAFDSVEEGNVILQLASNTTVEYQKRLDCFIKQYENMEVIF